jgi:hypothetical protein
LYRYHQKCIPFCVRIVDITAISDGMAAIAYLSFLQ